MAELIAAGTTYAESADFTVTAGVPTAFFIKPASGNGDPPGGVDFVLQHKSSSGLYNAVQTLNARNIADKGLLCAPGTYRMVRLGNGPASAGMDRE